jgi:hypothetical protein
MKLKNIELKVLKTDADVNLDMALDMLGVINENNNAGKKTVFIVPVGPTKQYPILAAMVNKLNISLKNVWFFNMDEYLTSPDTAISPQHFLSFHKRMNDEFYSLVREDLIMPAAQRLFPVPGKEKEYDALLESLGGADVCYGGVGINGHIAFNEATEQDDPTTAEEFAARGTRVLPITRETIAINGAAYMRGDIAAMPKWCITIGMKQILMSKRVYLSLGAAWHPGILKRILTEEPTPHIPATLLQKHGNVMFCTNEEITNGIF